MADCTESIIPILKNVQRRKKNPEQRFAKLRFRSDCVMLNVLDRDTRFFVKLVLFDCCAINMTVQKSTGLNFISVLLREYLWPFQWNQFTPSAWEEWLPRRYKPLRFEWWHLLYHQAPLYLMAQLWRPWLSLSWSLVVNGMPRWKARELPEFPEKVSSSMSITFDQQWAARMAEQNLKCQISII